MSAKRIFLGAATAIALSCGQAYAGVVFDQTPADDWDGGNLGSASKAVADDFSLAMDAIVNGMTFWTLEDPTPNTAWGTYFGGTTDHISYNIYDSNGVSPDASVLDAGNGFNGWELPTSFARVDHGVAPSWAGFGDLHLVEYSIDFAAPVDVVGGDQYWVALTMGTYDFSSGHLYWANTGAANPGTVGPYPGNGVNAWLGAPHPSTFFPYQWNMDPGFEVAFQLSGEYKVPLPAPLVLVLAGGLLLLRRARA